MSIYPVRHWLRVEINYIKYGKLLGGTWENGGNDKYRMKSWQKLQIASCFCRNVLGCTGN